MLDRLELTSRSMAKGLVPPLLPERWCPGVYSALRLQSSELLSLEVEKQISTGSPAIRNRALDPPERSFYVIHWQGTFSIFQLGRFDLSFDVDVVNLHNIVSGAA